MDIYSTIDSVIQGIKLFACPNYKKLQLNIFIPKYHKYIKIYSISKNKEDELYFTKKNIDILLGYNNVKIFILLSSDSIKKPWIQTYNPGKINVLAFHSSMKNNNLKKMLHYTLFVKDQ
jgi:hypothetical protein